MSMMILDVAPGDRDDAVAAVQALHRLRPVPDYSMFKVGSGAIYIATAWQGHVSCVRPAINGRLPQFEILHPKPLSFGEPIFSVRESPSPRRGLFARLRKAIRS